MRHPELIFQHSASADGFDVGIGARKHERGAGVARVADRAEHISVGIALIIGLVLEGGPIEPCGRQSAGLRLLQSVSRCFNAA
jgi:hypothetical protein